MACDIIWSEKFPTLSYQWMKIEMPNDIVMWKCNNCRIYVGMVDLTFSIETFYIYNNRSAHNEVKSTLTNDSWTINSEGCWIERDEVTILGCKIKISSLKNQ